MGEAVYPPYVLHGVGKELATDQNDSHRAQKDPGAQSRSPLQLKAFGKGQDDKTQGYQNEQKPYGPPSTVLAKRTYNGGAFFHLQAYRKLGWLELPEVGQL